MGTTVCQWSYKQHFWEDLNLSAQGKSVNAAFTFCCTREGENSFLVSSFQVYEMPRMTSYTKSWRSLQLRISTSCVAFRCLRRLVKTNINPKCMLKLKKHEYTIRYAIDLSKTWSVSVIVFMWVLHCSTLRERKKEIYFLALVMDQSDIGIGVDCRVKPLGPYINLLLGRFVVEFISIIPLNVTTSIRVV